MTQQTLVEFYQSLRPAIFTTSLTLGTFLFTMKTFIIQTMKKEVFDKPFYKQQVMARINGGKPKDTLYGSLRNFKTVLFLAIITAILNAFFQVTVGYIDTDCAAWACFGSTLVSWSFVGGCLWLVSKNLTSMLKYGELEFQDEFKAWKKTEDDKEEKRLAERSLNPKGASQEPKP
jgi:hypothetical protein